MNNTITIHNIKYSLADIEKDCWVRLVNGSVKSKDAMHFISLATFSSDAIGLRTVVLRKVDPVLKSIVFHTDVRSNKCKEINKNNKISALAYGNKIQIKIEGTATIHHNDTLANKAWRNIPIEGRKSYLTIDAPSTTKENPTDGLPQGFSARNITHEESEIGKINFAVVTVQVLKMDWLHLGAQGHCRAKFVYHNEDLIKMDWMVP